MAGGKETPRQKMIGLMYLVLMALLALNVTKEVLNAFVAIEENVQKAAQTQLERGDTSKKDLIEAMTESNAEKKVKIKYFLNIVDKIDQETAKRIQEIDEIKLDILKKSGEQVDIAKINDEESVLWVPYSKKNPLAPARFHLMAVQAKDQYDVPMHEIIGEDLTNITGTGKKLWKSYNDYRNTICDLLGTYSPPGGKSFSFKSTHINNFKDNKDLEKQVLKMMSKNKFNIDDDADILKQLYMDLSKNERFDTEEVKNLHWMGKTFDHSPLVAAIASLTSMEQEILSARATAVTHIKNKIGVGEYSFNKVMAISYGDAIANSGDEIEVGVMMAAFDSDNQPIVTSNNGQVSIADGRGKIKVKVGSGNEMKLSGTVSIKKKTGEIKTEKWERTVKIMKPQGTISIPGMNVFYRNYPNKIEAIVSGYDKVLLTPGAGSPKISGSGTSYIVSPGSARTCEIAISGKNSVTNKTVRLGVQQFRVSNLPKASLYYGNTEQNGTVSKPLIANTQILTTKYPPEIPLAANFAVTKWSVQIQGGPPPITGTGNKLPQNAIAYLRQAKSGAKIIISVEYSGMGYSGVKASSIITVE